MSYILATDRKRGLPVKTSLSMNLVYCGLCALAVATLYYGWRDHQSRHEGRHQLLRKRVTYMLWVMAQAAN
jgi:hypothetical protein